jgi:hypothetical protein
MLTVTVACKLPNGLHLDLKGRDRVTVRGPAVEWGKAPIAVGGYALTPDVDADHWAAWLALYKDAPFVKNRYIFAFPKPADATSAALEMKDEKCGLEPLDPDKPGPGLERVIA